MTPGSLRNPSRAAHLTRSPIVAGTPRPWLDPASAIAADRSGRSRQPTAIAPDAGNGTMLAFRGLAWTIGPSIVIAP